MVFRSCSWSCLLVVSVVVMMGVCVGVGEAAPPLVCLNGQQSLDAFTRKLCIALSNISKFSQAVEDFLDAEAIKSSMPINDREVKRQDLDHVFLRFGRSQQ